LEDTEMQSLLEKHLRLSSEIMILEIAIEASNLVIKESENKKWQVRRDFLPDDETEWSRLKREVDFNELLYTELKEDQGVTDILKSTEAEEIGTVRVVSPATVPKRQKGRLSTLIFGNFIGMFVALCLALMLEYRNNSFKRPHMLEAELKVPLLGVIPYAEGNGIKNIDIAKRGSCASDRFFKIVAAIFSPKKDNKTNVIQITSSVPREGKSFVSLNLAVSASELGYKVLLIDGNFRKPSLHSVFAVDIKFGLVDILAGGVLPINAVKKTSHERIDLMTCGENPMRASTIFNSESISSVISKVKPAYDFVLIDSAAINLYVDPTIISSVVDGVILVIEADKTQKESVAIAKKIIEEQSKVIGTVLNKMRYYIPEFIFQSISNLHIS
jgi:polysaccharide biosynthesis transport protein